jgi:hypothetical protein
MGMATSSRIKEAVRELLAIVTSLFIYEIAAKM